MTTSEATDYVFCASDKPVVFADDTVTIDGYAGAVRIFKDRVLLVNTSGQMGSVGYKGVVAQGIGPFEERMDVAPRFAGVMRVGTCES